MGSPVNADSTIRVLVVDDERPMREAYQEVLTSRRKSEAENLRARLFGDGSPAADTGPTFDVHTAVRAEAAVQAVKDSKAGGRGFDVVFLDMRMPPGPDGAWAAAQIRAIDPEVDIVIATAYSDVDPEELARRIPPADKLFYLQKPFHAHEVRQLAVALGRKARAEAHTRQLAYFDSLTGLANRDLARERISAAVESAKAQSRSLAVMFIDLDNFKRINDTLGHDVGDEILKATAVRLCATLRESDTVAASCRTSSAAWGATSSCFCCPTSSIPTMPPWWRNGSSAHSASPSGPTATTSPSRRASASRSIPLTARISRLCCAMPISPCTSPSGRAGASSSTTTRP